jgi:5-formyltetrahydrofolate cyclo-ligase
MTDVRAEVQRRKRELRQLGRGARSAMSVEERRAASYRIAERVIRASFFRRSKLIACYLPMPEEVNTWPVIERAWRMKKRIFAPICSRHRNLRFCEVRPETDLVRNDFSLLEPVEGEFVTARELDLVLTPMVAFDKKRSRIGMAGGYYDTTFSFLRGRRCLFRPKLVGLAFACQEVDDIPENPWDIRVYRVVTEAA